MPTSKMLPSTKTAEALDAVDYQHHPEVPDSKVSRAFKDRVIVPLLDLSAKDRKEVDALAKVSPTHLCDMYVLLARVDG